MKDEQKVIEQLLDEENTDNVILYDGDNNPLEFMQVALIPIKDDTYAVLKPISHIDGVEEDEVIVFKFVEDDDEQEDHLEVVVDDKINDLVLKELNKLLNK